MQTRNVVLTIGLIAAMSSTVDAQVVCVKNSPKGGPVRVRAACKITEVELGSLQAMQLLLGAISSQDAGATLRLSGVNLQIVSGSGSTAGPVNGKGNLIIGYNADNPGDGADSRTGSHNVVIGDDHTYTSSGGFVGGVDNGISAEGATVLTGGQNNASTSYSCVVGGGDNDANGVNAVVSGGYLNTASGPFSSVSGGSANTASGTDSSVSGGGGGTAPDFQDWVAGSLFEDD